jgi:hypothetical protein
MFRHFVKQGDGPVKKELITTEYASGFHLRYLRRISRHRTTNFTGISSARY